MPTDRFKVLPAIVFSQKGATLVELAIALLLTTTILIGGIQFFFGGKKLLQNARIRRLAAIHLNERAEYLRHLGYSQITTLLNEDQQPISIAKYQFWRKTEVLSIDDPLDGTGSGDRDGNPIDFKQINLQLSWSDQPAAQLRVSLIVGEDYQL